MPLSALVSRPHLCVLSKNSNRCVRTTNPNPRPNPIFCEAQKAMRHCRFAFSDPRAMPRSMVERFQTKLGAVGLFVVGITDAGERVKQSSVQSDSLIAFLQQEKSTRADKDNCMALVVEDTRLEQEDRRRLLTAISAGPKARQDGQKWSPAILNIFTSTDWETWKPEDPSMPTTRSTR